MARPLGKKKAAPNAAVALGVDVLDAYRKDLSLRGDEEAFLEDDAGRLFKYNGRFWREINDSTLKAICLKHAADPMRQTDRQRSEAVRYIRARCHLERHEWGRVADNEVACQNGVVDVLTKKIRPHRAADYLESVIPWNYRPAAISETLDAYLASCFGDTDAQRPAALQAFAGYCLASHAKLKKALVLEGPGNTGKSQFVLMLKELVGSEFASSLSVEEMDDPVARAVLVGKRLNLLTELPAEAIIKDGGFKTLVSTGDPVSINPKYGHPFMYVSAAKHVIATNNLPTVTDRTDATFSRLYIVPFDRPIPKAEQDRDLLAKLVSEMEGVLAWAVEGAKRLIGTGGEFPIVEMADARMQQMREEANPVASFVRQEMVAEVGSATPINELARAFNAWHGGKKLDLRQVSRMLRAAFGSDAVGKSWNPGLKLTAQSLRGYRMLTDDERSVAENRTDWEASNGQI